MRRHGLIYKISSKNIDSSVKSMQVLDEQSNVYFNFINSLKSEPTRRSYKFCIQKFLGHYEMDLELQSQEVLDSSVLASPIIQLLTNRNDKDWIGTPTELLSDLEYCTEQLRPFVLSKYSMRLY